MKSLQLAIPPPLEGDGFLSPCPLKAFSLEDVPRSLTMPADAQDLLMILFSTAGESFKQRQCINTNVTRFINCVKDFDRISR